MSQLNSVLWILLFELHIIFTFHAIYICLYFVQLFLAYATYKKQMTGDRPTLAHRFIVC